MCQKEPEAKQAFFVYETNLTVFLIARRSLW
jgi:hypothetical protein